MNKTLDVTNNEVIDNDIDNEEGPEECSTEAEEQEAIAKRAVFSGRSVDARLFNAGMAVENAISNEDISAALAEFGYDEERFEEGRALVAEAQRMSDLQKINYATRTSEYERYSDLDRVMENYYKTYLSIAKNLFVDDDGITDLLELDGHRERTLSGKVNQIRRFFTNAMSDGVLPAFEEHNIEAEILETGVSHTEGVEEAYRAFRDADAIAQETTQDRDAAFEKMEDWVKKMITFAKAGLDDSPQLLEALGVLVRSPTTKSKDRQKYPNLEDPPPIVIIPAKASSVPSTGSETEAKSETVTSKKKKEVKKS